MALLKPSKSPPDSTSIIEPEGAIYELDIIFQRNAKELLRPSESVTVVLP